MKVLVLSASPNTEGLTAACVQAAMDGIDLSGAEVAYCSLNTLSLSACRVCNNGWGDCREKGTCCIEDAFEEVHAEIADADCFVLITPVYWSDMAEPMKIFIDRLRRCEAIRGKNSSVFGKKCIIVAAAGGTGNGQLSCLTQLERACQHVGAYVFDAIGISRRTRTHKLAAIKDGVTAMCQYQL